MMLMDGRKKYDIIRFTREFAQITSDLSQEVTTNGIIRSFLKRIEQYLGEGYLLIMPFFSSDYRSDQIKFEFDDEYQFMLTADAKYSEMIMDEMAVHYAYRIGVAQYFCNHFSKPAAVEMKKEGKVIVVTQKEYDQPLEVKGKDDSNRDTATFLYKCIADISSYEGALDKKIQVQTENEDLKKAVREIKDGFIAHSPFLHDEHCVYFISEPNICINGKTKSTGGLFIIKDGEMNPYELKFFIVSEFLLASKIEIANDIKAAHKYAVRAAIAQVMARNMSHNFGSHVLSNLIGDDVYDKVNDDKVKKLLERFISTDEWNTEVFKNDGKNRQLPFFFQYLKSRMDYLSEVTFGVPNLLTTKMMYNDVMKELDQVRILLNYISGVSNFKYEFKLEGFDSKVKDIGVAFPSDVLGCQAFYNIIENIIRNTAKHAKNNNGETVAFTITIKDNFAEKAGCKDVEGVDELYCVEIDNGVTEDNIDVLVNGGKDEYGKEIKGQNNRLNDSVLEGQNLRSSSLGLLEMEASAAFLRQIDLPEIESEDYTVDYDDTYYHIDSKGKKRLNILKAFAIDEKVEERTNDKDGRIKVKMGRLGYRFFLQKPKEFLLVGNWCVTDEKKKQLLNCGIQFLTNEEFCTAMRSEKAFAHQFLIYQDISKEAKTYLHPDNDCKTLLPLRKLMVPMDDKQEIEGFWMGGEKDSVDGKQVLQSLKEFAWNRYFEEVVINQMKNCQNQKCKILEQINREEDNQVVFLDHGNFSTHKEAWRGDQKIDRNTGQSLFLQGAKEITDKEIWIENLSSRTQGKLPLFNNYCHPKEEPVPQDGHQAVSQAPHAEVTHYIQNICSEPQIIYEIFEAYHNKVVVIDERVQKFAMENKEGSGNEMINSIDLHESTNVHVPRLPKSEKEETDDNFSLDPTDFSELKNKVVAYVDKHINGDNNKPIILVHYGVLERMCGGNVGDINEILNNWAGKGKAKRVVVTSGRGSHSLDLPNSVCFVNLSSVLYAFNENRNKYLINNLLNQSRRKRNE